MRALHSSTIPRFALIAVALCIGLSVYAAPAAGGLSDTIDRVKPSIVAVGTFQKTRSPAFAFRGTGFVVDDGTLVVTNAHVVPETLQSGSPETMIVLAPGLPGRDPEGRDVKLLAIDREHDLALLRLSGKPLPGLKIGGSGAVREGKSVAFTGFPIGSALGFVPVTHRGTISAITPIALPAPTARQLNERAVQSLKSGAFLVFQLDATAYPGNSGSPLYDDETGEVIGIINMVFVKGAKESALREPTGISFAVPARYLEELLSNAR